MISIAIFVLMLILLLAGLVGVALRILPGVSLMFVMTLIYAFVNHFERLSVTDIVILGVIALAAELIDYFSGVYGAKIFGASKAGIIGGMIGSMIGLFLLPPLGLFIGLVGGVALVELVIKKKTVRHSTRAAAGALIGSITGLVINLILAITFIVIFSIKYWK
jgi:uncharacterized protein YqgC (DUF456 family)